MKDKLQLTTPGNLAEVTSLVSEIGALIEAAKHRVAVSVNAELTLLNWQIGNSINLFVLKGKRAAYGKQILSTVSKELTVLYGYGFSVSLLSRMLNFADLFPDKKKVATLSQELNWSHFVELISIKDDLKREFYLQICRMERWGVRTLRKKLDSQLYERTAISKKPEKLIKEELELMKKDNVLTPNRVFRDPYILDFLDLKETYSEKDIESAILIEIQKFIIELGTDFAFLARQKRITIDQEDFYIDLLFYHRKLKCLVAIDLKLDKFKAAYKGQMELYLRWLEKYEMQPDEQLPMGLILCAEKSHERIELLQLDKGNIRVAQYLTELPPKKLLQAKLQEAISRARNLFEYNRVQQDEEII
jgi:predicted nuclease of restriction endonuclease-like (RecB) superfamily